MANKPSNSTPASDDRNLVSTGATDLNELEDQLALWWDKYKKHVLLAIGVILGVFIIYHVVQFSARAARESEAEDYKNATDKLAWAESNESSPLAGFAFTELANAAYQDGDFEKAITLYEKAAATSKSAIKSSALMGQAVSLLQLSRNDEAEAILEPLADNSASGNSAEAKFRLAELAAEREDFTQARLLIEGVMENPSQTTYYWMQKGMMLQANFPPAPEEEAAE